MCQGAWEAERKETRQTRLVRKALIKQKRALAIIYFLFLEFSRQAREKRDFLGRWNDVKELTRMCIHQDLSKNKWKVYFFFPLCREKRM